MGEAAAQRHVVGGELLGVAGVEHGRLVELGVAHPGGVGPDAPQAAHPRRTAVEDGVEVCGMGAVDHVVRRRAPRRGVDRLDGGTQRLTRGEDAVHLDGEGDDGRDAGLPGGEHHPDGLVGGGHGDAGDQVHPCLRHDAGLGGVVGERLLARHHLTGLVAVAAGPDAAAHDHGRLGGLVPLPQLPEHGDGVTGEVGELLGAVAEPGGPVGAGPPRRGLEDDADAVAPRDGEVALEVAHQGGPALGVVEQGEGGEVGQVEAVVEDERRLEPAVGEEHLGVELGQVVAFGGHWNAPSVVGRPVGVRSSLTT